MHDPINKGEKMKAFPYAVPMDFEYAETGMDLRDYFAGLAMQGLIIGYMSQDKSYFVDEFSESEQAYVIADAMMEARNDRSNQ